VITRGEAKEGGRQSKRRETAEICDNEWGGWGGRIYLKMKARCEHRERKHLKNVENLILSPRGKGHVKKMKEKKKKARQPQAIREAATQKRCVHVYSREKGRSGGEGESVARTRETPRKDAGKKGRGQVFLYT